MTLTRRSILSWTSLVLLLAAPFHAPAQSTSAERWFEVGSLNKGLRETPADLDRHTPRQVVSELLRLAERGDYENAAHLLNLNDLSEAEQRTRGPELARKLVDVISRTMVIDWGALPARPDALLEQSGNQAPLAGQERRSLSLSLLELERRPAEIRISRYKPSEGEAVWVFSPQTVRDIDLLYQRYGPGWLEKLMPDSLQQPSIFGMRGWEWLALPLLLLTLALLGWGTHRVVDWLGRRSRVTWFNRTADRLSIPLALALTGMVGHLLTGWVIRFSGFFFTWLTPLFFGMMIIGLARAALSLIDATLDKATKGFLGDIDDRNDRDQRELYTSIYALRRFVLLAAVLISAVLILLELRVFDDVGTTLLASAGVVTVVLGIAGRTVIGNILASFQIAIAKPVRIGDTVKYQDYWGYVESIYYSFLVLRVWDGRRLVVPVQYFITYPFENWSMVDASITRTFTLRLDHGARPGELRDVFEEIVSEDGDAVDGGMTLTLVTEHNEDYQEISFVATGGNPADTWLMEMRLREAMGDWIRDNHPEWWQSDRLLVARSGNPRA